MRILYLEDSEWYRPRLGIVFRNRLPSVTLVAPPTLAAFRLMTEGKKFDLLAISPELPEWRAIYRDLSTEVSWLMADPCFVLCLTQDDALRAAMRDEYNVVLSKRGQRTILSAKKSPDGVARALDEIQDLVGAQQRTPMFGRP